MMVDLINFLNSDKIMQFIKAFRSHLLTIFKLGFIILFYVTHAKANHCPGANAKDYFEAAAQIRAQQNSSLDATLEYMLTSCM